MMILGKNIKRIRAVFILACSIFVIGCSNSTFAPNAQSFGGMNRIIVVADQEMWDGPVGDTLRFYLGAAYPVLPQPEPLFDLQHFTTDEINENRDRLRFRNMLYLADMSNTISPTSASLKEILGEDNIDKMSTSETKSDVKISNGRWAADQIVLFFYSNGEQAAIDNIKSKSSSVAKMIREHDSDMLEHRVYYSGKNVRLNNSIKEQFGFNITIPSDYTLAMNEEEEGFVWIRKLEQNSHIHNNILIQKIPYKATEQLEPESIKNLRDSLGRKYIESGQIEGSFMRVNDIDLPLFHEPKTVDGKFGMELRGIWEMSDDRDMMGGPFISYMIHDANTEELIFIDGFVFAPGKEKRDMMLGMELILSSVSFED